MSPVKCFLALCRDGLYPYCGKNRLPQLPGGTYDEQLSHLVFFEVSVVCNFVAMFHQHIQISNEPKHPNDNLLPA